MSYFGKIVKNTLIFAAVGALLALAAPHIAGLIGLEALELGLINSAGAFTIAHAPLWTGAFFGAFGGIHAAVEPLINGLLGGKSKPEQTQTRVTTRTVSHGHHADLAQDIAPDMPETTKFRDMTAPARSTDASFQERFAASEASAPQGHTLH